MSLQSPWDLVSAATVPSTVQWYALDEQPGGGVLPTDVQDAALPGVTITATLGPVESSGDAGVIWRSYTLTITATEPGVRWPAVVAMVAAIDTAEGGGTLVLFAPATNLYLAGVGSTWILIGWLTVYRYGGSNG